MLHLNPGTDDVEAIGKRFGLTRERVRQMEQQALERLGIIMAREFGEERTAKHSRRRPVAEA